MYCEWIDVDIRLIESKLKWLFSIVEITNGLSIRCLTAQPLNKDEHHNGPVTCDIQFLGKDMKVQASRNTVYFFRVEGEHLGVYYVGRKSLKLVQHLLRVF